jgi:DNA mismatch endonuclease, patch repair protein
MADVLTPEQRRLNMSRIRGRNTKPEKRLRSALHAQGLRFRLHRRDLPGSPDIVFVGKKVAVFVDGCFWHGCPEHGVKPKTNGRFWLDKIKGNRERDRKATKKLRRLGWRVMRVWEHDLKRDVPHTVRSIEKVIRSRPARRE